MRYQSPGPEHSGSGFDNYIYTEILLSGPTYSAGPLVINHQHPPNVFMIQVANVYKYSLMALLLILYDDEQFCENTSRSKDELGIPQNPYFDPSHTSVASLWLITGVD